MSDFFINSFSVQPALPVVSGGTLTSDATYYYRTFTANGTLIITDSSLIADLLVVAGGGGGGDGSLWGGGSGAGAGGVLNPTSIVLAPNSYPIVIGAGGVGSDQAVAYTSASKGSNTTVSGYTAFGGGCGQPGNPSQADMNGGSGGGTNGAQSAGRGLGTAGQGNDGGWNVSGPYAVGGGGGKNSVGSNSGVYGSGKIGGGNGGAGVTIYGRNVGGGGGGASGHGNNGIGCSPIGFGGFGGGGNSMGGAYENFRAQYYGYWTSAYEAYYGPMIQPTAGTVNTGGGGGGGMSWSSPPGGQNYIGKNGGSGIVVVRYTRSQVGG